MTYEALLKLYEEKGIDIYERKMIHKGLYADDIIFINKDLTTNEKACVLSEELGHYETSSGDILDQQITDNIKQERRARNWGYETLIPLERFIEAHKHHCQNRTEIADFLDVTEEFLYETVTFYHHKYGYSYRYNDNYTITFEPLGVYYKMP